MTYITYIVLMSITSIVIWYQTVAPIRFPLFLNKYSYIVYLLGLLASILYVEASKVGAVIFNDTWSLRFVAFGLNTIIFVVFSYLFINTNVDYKHIVCLILSFVIVFIQCFSK